MTAQVLWIVFGVFLLGLFFGCNAGVLLMCVLQMAGRESRKAERALSYPVEIK